MSKQIGKFFSNIAGILCLASIVGIFVGIFLWAAVFTENEVARLVGCIIFFASFGILLIASFSSKAQAAADAYGGIKKALIYIGFTLGGALIAVAVFSFFAYLHLVPGINYTEGLTRFFGIFAVALMIVGGGSYGGDVIIVIRINRR